MISGIRLGVWSRQGVAEMGERVTFSSPDENARAGETAPKLQCQPTPCLGSTIVVTRLATPLVSCCAF